jgi:hypothetical protein
VLVVAQCPNITKDRVKAYLGVRKPTWMASSRSAQSEDATAYRHALIPERREVRKRKENRSKRCPQQFGHTPLSIEEEIPWKCHRLVVGSPAYGRLPMMQKLRREDESHKIKFVLSTLEVIEILNREPEDTNAILHVTCQLSAYSHPGDGRSGESRMKHLRYLARC